MKKDGNNAGMPRVSAYYIKHNICAQTDLRHDCQKMNGSSWPAVYKP
jgi:hypothetical protein